MSDEKIPVPTWIESETDGETVTHQVTFDDKTTKIFVEDDIDGDTEKQEVTE